MIGETFFALLSALAAVLGTLLAVGITIGIGRLVTWVVPAVPRPDPLVELWQEREVRAGRFPDVADPRRNRGQHGARKQRTKEAARRERRRRR